MYSKAKRKFHLDAKQGNPYVGPSTYVVDFVRDLKEEAVPFRFKIGHRPLFSNYQCTPAPNKYLIKYRKRKILGGSSLRYTDERKTDNFNPLEPTPTTYDTEHWKFEPVPRPRFAICRGRPPLNAALFRKKAQEIRITIRRTDSDPPKCHCDSSGPKWSISNTPRFREIISTTPGPANYNLNRCGPTYQEQWDDAVRLANKTGAKLTRYVDQLLEKGKADDIPSATRYTVPEEIFKKKSFNVKGTFTQEVRIPPPRCSDLPGPSSYDIKSPFGVTCLRNELELPFNSTSAKRRFVHKYPVGPADYYPMQDTIAFRLCKKLPPWSARFVAPFNSTEPRIDMMHESSTPAPWDYDIQPKPKRPVYKLFEEPMQSKTPRFPENKKTEYPSPLQYNLFGVASRQKHCDHHKIFPPFNSSQKRDLTALPNVQEAAPNLYYPNMDAVKRRSPTVLIGTKFRPKKKPLTPGPAHYDIHPLYSDACIKAYTTHNVSYPQVDTFGTQGDKDPKLPKKILKFFVRPPQKAESKKSISLMY